MRKNSRNRTGRRILSHPVSLRTLRESLSSHVPESQDRSTRPLSDSSETIALVFGWSTKIVTVTTSATDGSYTYTVTGPTTTGSYNVDAYFLGDYSGSPQYLPSKATAMITVTWPHVNYGHIKLRRQQQPTFYRANRKRSNGRLDGTQESAGSVKNRKPRHMRFA